MISSEFKRGTSKFSLLKFSLDPTGIVFVVSDTKDNKIIIKSSHNGYKNFIGGSIHQRIWEIEKNKLSIKDKLLGENASGMSRLYLHPDVEIKSVNEYQIKLMHSDGNPILIDIPDSKFILKDSNYYCEFGLAVSNKCIEIELKNNSCRLSLTKL